MDAINQPIRLLLVVPPERETLEGFSSGLVAIANYVSARLGDRVAVEIHDLSRVNSEHVGQKLEFLRSTTGDVFVGITTTTATYQSALWVARVVKRLNSNARVIMGGHHAQAQGEVILRRHRPDVDYIVKGEGEIPLVELLTHFPRIDAVPGLMWIDPMTERLRANPPPPFLASAELDGIDPWFDGVLLGSPPGKFGHVTYVSARGCPLKCAFCAVANEKIRCKSDEAIIRDLRRLVVEKGFQRIAFENNFFAQSRRSTESLCRAIIAERERDPAFRFEWDCQTRVESIRHRGMVQLMREAGCRAVYLGVENFHPEMLRYLGKVVAPDQYIRQTNEAAMSLTEAGIEVYVNIQIGLPRETDDVREHNLRHLRELARSVEGRGGRLVIFPMLAVVYPGTAHFNDLRSQGVPEEIFETYTRWEEEHDEVLRFFGRNFAHGRGGLPLGILVREEILRGNPVLDYSRQEEVMAYLERIRSIQELTVFDYSKHLVAPVGCATMKESGQ